MNSINHLIKLCVGISLAGISFVLKGQEHPHKEFAIVVPTYNNSAFCIRNLDSILCQRYDNFHVYIIDDVSTDDTYDKLYAYVIKHPRRDHVTLQRNQERVGAAANYYHCINALDDHVIVLNVDGDDFLAHDRVLLILNDVYQDSNIWLTYGQFRQYPSQEIGFCRPIALENILDHNYRDSDWLATHLRTYYAWLFKKIDKKDLCHQGKFLRACADRAIMYPLLEMCAGHFKCISEVLYMYNCANPIADVRTNLTLQQRMCGYIRLLPPYQPLDGIYIMNEEYAYV